MTRAQAGTPRIALILAWEVLAAGWLGMLVAMLAALALPSAICYLFSWEGGRLIPLHGTEPGNMLWFALYWIIVLNLAAVDLWQLGNPKHRFILPAPSWLLVAVPMILTMLIVMAQFAVVTATVNAWFGTGWPILGPALLAAALAAWCHAVLWSTSNSKGLQVLAFCVAVAPPLFFIGRWTLPEHQQTRQLLEFDARFLLLFAAATAASLVVGAIGFGRVRRGAVIDLSRIADGLGKLVTAVSSFPSKRFRSARSAQMWLEWTERGYVVPLYTTLTAVLMVGAACVLSRKNASGLPGITALVMAATCVVGIYLGSRSSTSVYGNFGGSRPLTDYQLASAVLKNVTLALFSGAVIWLVALGIVIVIILGKFRAVGPVDLTPLSGLAAGMALWAVGLWSFVSLVTSLALSGRREVGLGFVAMVCAFLAGFAIVAILPEDRKENFANAYFSTYLALCVLGALAIFVAGFRLTLIGVRTCMAAILIVLLALGAAEVAGAPHEWRRLLVIAGGFSLIPLPLAAAPLAVYVNRHR